MTRGMTAQVSHILTFLETWAPQSTKLDYDNVGLLVGSPEAAVHSVLVCLDVTQAVIDEAIQRKCDLIVAHHPLIFKRISHIIPDGDQGASLYKLIRNDISLITAHTNLDAASGGVSFALAERLGLNHVDFLDRADDGTTGMGAVGIIPDKEGIPEDEFLNLVCDRLACRALRYSGSSKTIKKVAVCGGAGVFLLNKAAMSGAHAFVTADIKYHDYFHNNDNFMLIDAGHYETEIPVVPVIKEKLKQAFPNLEIHVTDVKTSPMHTHLSRISVNSNHVKTNIKY